MELAPHLRRLGNDVVASYLIDLPWHGSPADIVAAVRTP